jgi:hypothetical protein
MRAVALRKANWETCRMRYYENLLRGARVPFPVITRRVEPATQVPVQELSPRGPEEHKTALALASTSLFWFETTRQGLLGQKFWRLAGGDRWSGIRRALRATR